MKRKVKTAGKPRKRSKHIHDLQETISIFNDAEGTSVNTELIKGLTLTELYEDYETSKDTEFTPFKFLSTETKAEFLNELERLGNALKETLSYDRDETLKVGDSHKHDLIPPKRFKEFFKKRIGSPDPSFYLDDKQSNYLYQLDRYDLWENFITPKLFSKSRGNTTLQMSFETFSQIIQNELGFEVFTYGFNRDKLLHVIIKLDSSDVFFVCCIFTLLDVHSKLAENFDRAIDHNFSMKNNVKFYEQNHIAEMEIGLENYYYFTCGCEK